MTQRTRERMPLQRKRAFTDTPGTAGRQSEAQSGHTLLQRATIEQPDAAGIPPVVEEVLQSSGQALDSETRAFMEPRFGHDFSQVQVHTDDQAAESAQAVNALAYTVGSDVVFGAGEYDPDSAEGQELLAHELTHVVQQESGEVSPEPATKGLTVSEPGDPFEQEADQVAAQVMAGESAGIVGAADGLLQRQTPEEAQQAALDLGRITAEEDVELLPPPTEETSWAAAIGMIAGARDGEEYPVEAIAAEAEMDMTIAYGWSDIQNAAAAWDLGENESESMLPGDWSAQLEADGPLWVIDPHDPEHTFIMGALDGDGSLEATDITVYDPLPAGKGSEETLPFADFAEDFGLSEGYSVDIRHG
jgi:hypothetical protein